MGHIQCGHLATAFLEFVAFDFGPAAVTEGGTPIRMPVRRLPVRARAPGA
jgi:hypothetical protein